MIFLLKSLLVFLPKYSHRSVIIILLTFIYMQFIDKFLDRITMYRLMLYGLGLLSIIAIIFGFFGVISYGGISLIISALVITTTCYVSNILLAKIFHADINTESSAITGFILFLILLPISGGHDALISILASVIA